MESEIKPSDLKFNCKVHGDIPTTHISVTKTCKLCRCVTAARYRKKNPEKVKAYDKKRMQLYKKPKLNEVIK